MASSVGDPLPDAPSADSSVHASEQVRYSRSKWFGVVDPGEKIPPLYTRDKMMFWLHAFTSAGWGNLVGGDPKYGSDSGAFGERLGAAVVRQASMRFFSDSLLPAVTHEDPRYFRRAHGPITQRGVYAAERTFVSQRDNGSHGFNYSGVLGRAAAMALTIAYYPHASANWRAAAQGWGVSLAGSAGINLFHEFCPDARDRWFRRRTPE
jgi:hypothetical protein